jgi:hypothetical protein
MIYIQEAEPGIPTFGDEWRVPSTGLCYQYGSSWTLRGDAARQNLGILLKSGGEIGSSGIDWASVVPWIRITAGAITTSTAFLDGKQLLTTSDITSENTDINSSIVSNVNAAMQTISATGNDSICVVTGTLPFSDDAPNIDPTQFTARIIPKPTFKDGTEPTDALTFCFYWQDGIPYSVVEMDPIAVYQGVSETSPLSRSIEASYYTIYHEAMDPMQPYTSYQGLDLHYVCFGIR